VCRVISWVFDCTARDVPRARRGVRQALRAWEVPDDDPARDVWGDLEVVVGEVASNAARFCTGRFELTLEVHRDHVRVDVVDDGPATESLRLTSGPPAPDAESGRGLSIVAALASHWGAERVTTSLTSGNGTRVWAELTFAAESPHFTPSCEIVVV
jgi:anti-sigma regulatory factor (Ser/Thr protein kinase)